LDTDRITVQSGGWYANAAITVYTVVLDSSPHFFTDRKGLLKPLAVTHVQNGEFIDFPSAIEIFLKMYTGYKRSFLQRKNLSFLLS
jgi:hypothetical protein